MCASLELLGNGRTVMLQILILRLRQSTRVCLHVGKSFVKSDAVLGPFSGPNQKLNCV